MGGDLKAAFCLVKDGNAVLSAHQGDLANPAAFDDYRENLDLYRDLFGHRPAAIALRPASASICPPNWRGIGRRRADLPLIEVQHHHAHVAACLAENGRPLDAPPVLGIVLDGLGWGDDGTIWGGEFLLADYRAYRRLGSLAPVAMPGGDAAVARALAQSLCAAGAGDGLDRAARPVRRGRRRLPIWPRSRARRSTG